MEKKSGRVKNLEKRFRTLIEPVADEAERMLARSAEEKNAKEEWGQPGWPDGTLALGLCEAGRFGALARYADEWISHGAPVTSVDAGLFGYSLIALYERGGGEKYGNAARKIADFFKNTWPRDREGTLLYSDRDENGRVYSDGTGMGTAFSARYARVFGDREFSDIAARQIANWMKNGIDPETGLAYHGYSVKEDIRFPNLGWGRGTGWLALAVGSCAESLRDPATDALCEKFLTDVLRFRMKNGMLSWNLPDTDGPSDTSATGMIFWGALKMKERGLLPDLAPDELVSSADAAAPFVRDGGKVFGSHGECYDFGYYSDKFDEHNKWGQGATLAFFAALDRFV